ncbi:hypothetical protein AO354_34345 [Pseudomonas syringae pv. syringae]|nr:hypothetical protein AO354_34345 [Pseudomonas syringae pv. syringae]
MTINSDGDGMQMRGSAVQNMGLMISVLLVALNLRPSMACFHWRLSVWQPWRVCFSILLPN